MNIICKDCQASTKHIARGRCLLCYRKFHYIEIRDEKSREKYRAKATEYRKNFREKAKEFRKVINKLKLDLGCIDCGYNLHPEALDFDHIKGDKKGSISHMIRHFSPEIVYQEIDKCVVRCANCHRIKTSLERDKN